MNTVNAESSISVPAATRAASSKKKGLMIIGTFKLLKGTLFLVVALGMLRLLHHDVQEWGEDMLSKLRFDPDNRHIAWLLSKLGLVDDHRLRELSGLTLIYASLFLTEGIGLLRQKRWAEYLTVVATASLIPLEIYEVFRHVTWVRVLLFAGNVAILVYLLFIIRKEKHG
jgi:uncharacterized membrane protein (DUF2068 family)